MGLLSWWREHRRRGKRRAEIYREAREALRQLEATTAWTDGEISLRLLELGLLILQGTVAAWTLLDQPPPPEAQENRPVLH
jgi:hypothetical protein